MEAELPSSRLPGQASSDARQAGAAGQPGALGALHGHRLAEAELCKAEKGGEREGRDQEGEVQSIRPMLTASAPLEGLHCIDFFPSLFFGLKSFSAL